MVLTFALYHTNKKISITISLTTAFYSNGTLAGAWHIQARRFASRASTRQTTHLNSDKKVNSKPSETGRSPLNRLANRPVILRSSAKFWVFAPFLSSECFRLRFVSGGVSLRRPFLLPQKPFFSPFRVWLYSLKTSKIHAKPTSTHSRFLTAYDIIVDVTTTSHFGTFRSHRCPCVCQIPVV